MRQKWKHYLRPASHIPHHSPSRFFSLWLMRTGVPCPDAGAGFPGGPLFFAPLLLCCGTYEGTPYSTSRTLPLSSTSDEIPFGPDPIRTSHRMCMLCLRNMGSSHRRRVVHLVRSNKEWLQLQIGGPRSPERDDEWGYSCPSDGKPSQLLAAFPAFEQRRTTVLLKPQY